MAADHAAVQHIFQNVDDYGQCAPFPARTLGLSEIPSVRRRHGPPAAVDTMHECSVEASRVRGSMLVCSRPTSPLEKFISAAESFAMFEIVNVGGDDVSPGNLPASEGRRTRVPQ